MSKHSILLQRVRRVRGTNDQRIPGAIVAIGLIFILGLGYIAGTFNNQIVATVAPLFGAKVYTGSLDTTSIQATYRALKANYDGTIDDKALIEAANKGMVSSLGDPYTLYFNAQEAANFNNDLTGTIGGGIGVELNLRNNQVVVVRVLAHNPAEKAGIAVGDVLTKINDTAVAVGDSLDTTVSKIRGDAGTTVKITVLRGTVTKDFTITRAQVTNPSVYSTVSGGIGIMTITRFDDQTGQLARSSAQSFKSQNVRAVILDLRGNGGGYLTAAQDVVGLWESGKTVVTEKTNGKVVDQLTSGTDAILKGLPTVVLVNTSSASASEIAAGALQDYGTAKLVGEKTFGKGSVQKLIGLPDGAQLKVTIANWYTPNGKNINKEGITPDKIVPLTTEDSNAGRDPQLDAAKALLAP
ncbi:MAG: S41 family peptidase [Candidatus Microsaccharimonas sossegonensis]|uniref:S41 family peptidase n=1 Tax=Candidatus Microsaccharimonas sossegonensis TaxID=2506948 RepID=A0A4Q0AIU6_9BACT|nr:MAG: S41 family peptidase [Candidatus Microsaccharimonas sossegonensis]